MRAVNFCVLCAAARARAREQYHPSVFGFVVALHHLVVSGWCSPDIEGMEVLRHSPQRSGSYLDLSIGCSSQRSGSYLDLSACSSGDLSVYSEVFPIRSNSNTSLNWSLEECKGWSLLPTELWVAVFLSLPPEYLIKNVLLVCKRFYEYVLV